jgi:hypothetical protein
MRNVNGSGCCQSFLNFVCIFSYLLYVLELHPLTHCCNLCPRCLSVFPAEACEDTGTNCDAEGVFEEVSPSTPAATTTAEQKPGPDREYEEYKGDKT